MSSAATKCAAGDDLRDVVYAEAGPDFKAYTLFEGSSSSVVLLNLRAETSVAVGMVRTSVPPPENIIDLSPVYWIGSSGAWPLAARIAIPLDTGTGLAVLDSTSLKVYYSEDGAQFVGLASNTQLGLTAMVPGPGYLVAGAGPNAIQCGP
jgi:hypothetical protein